MAYNADFFESNYHSDKKNQPAFRFRIAALDDRISSEFVLDAADGTPGTKVDLEDLLGLSDSETTYQFDVMYRFLDFHRIELSYTDVSRNGAVTTSRDIEFGDQTFPAGQLVTTSFDSSSTRLSYGYSIIRDDQKELGISAGFHHTNLETKLQALGQLERSAPDPLLPVIGAYASVSLGQKIEVSAEVQAFRLDFDYYDSSMTTARVDVTYHLGTAALGVGYSYHSMDIESANDDLQGSFDFTHQGPIVSMSFSF